MRINGPLRSLFDHYVRGRYRRELRRRAGRSRMAGLRGTVEVLTDERGVPHIRADAREDLFFAQGYVTARDRLFQLDYNRHAVRGRICELVGRRALPWRQLTVHLRDRDTYDVDVMMRTFGLEHVAERSEALLSAEARDVLAAFTAGVNAYIDEGHRTLEHRILGTKPTPWRPSDSLVLVKAIGFELNYAWRAILLGALLIEDGVPEELARVLWPHYPAGAPPIVGASEIAADAVAADAALGIASRPGAGSNCWAVAGRRSADGAALLANDTHLTLSAPEPWHEVRLQGGGIDLQGFALAGTPGVSIGRTPHCAWGITAGLVQDLDLFIEQLKPDDPTQYKTPDGWAALEGREESFTVRGEADHTRTIWSSRHGPLLETVHTEPAAGQRFAVCWTGHTASSELDAFVSVWHAASFEDVRRGFSRHGCPTFNILYADRGGNIGYQLAGTIPKRKLGTPLRPLEGWTGEWDWDGFVPYEDNPHEYNPERGFLATANNRVAPWDYPHELGSSFEPPQRYQRICALLSQNESASFDDMVRMQSDVFSAWGLQATQTLMQVVGGSAGLAPAQQSLARSAAETWEAWDGQAGAESVGAAVAYVTLYTFAYEIVRRLASEAAALAFVELSSFTEPPLLELIEREPLLRAAGVDLAATVRESFEASVRQLSRQLGSDEKRWSWGAIHPLRIPHRMNASALGSLFAIGPEPSGGGPDTLNRGDMNANVSYRVTLAPALRMVVSMKSIDRAATILPGGQSGDRFSPHYDDQVASFLRGALEPAPMSRDAVDVACEERWAPGRK